MVESVFWRHPNSILEAIQKCDLYRKCKIICCFWCKTFQNDNAWRRDWAATYCISDNDVYSWGAGGQPLLVLIGVVSKEMFDNVMKRFSFTISNFIKKIKSDYKWISSIYCISVTRDRNVHAFLYISYRIWLIATHHTGGQGISRRVLLPPPGNKPDVIIIRRSG